MVMGRQRLLSMALIVSLAAISVIIYTNSDPDQYVFPTPPVRSSSESGPAQVNPRITEPAPKLEAFSEVVDRPLFSRTRRPQTSTDVASSEPSPALPVKKYQFLVMGIIITGTEKVAMLKPTGKSSDVFRAREGERVLDWTVETIYPEAVTIRQGNITDTLKLSDNVMSKAEKRRLTQQSNRQSRTADKQAAQRKRMRSKTKDTSARKTNAKTSTTSRRIPDRRPVTQGTSNADQKRERSAGG